MNRTRSLRFLAAAILLVLACGLAVFLGRRPAAVLKLPAGERRSPSGDALHLLKGRQSAGPGASARRVDTPIAGTGSSRVDAPGGNAPGAGTAPPAAPAVTPGSIDCQAVEISTGEALPGVRILAWPSGAREPLQSVAADATGHAFLADVPPGKCNLTALLGLQPTGLRQEVLVRAGQTVEAVLKLPARESWRFLVRDPQGHPQAGREVRFYSRNRPAPEEASCIGGQATTAADGTAMIRCFGFPPLMSIDLGEGNWVSTGREGPWQQRIDLKPGEVPANGDPIGLFVRSGLVEAHGHITNPPRDTELKVDVEVKDLARSVLGSRLDGDEVRFSAPPGSVAMVHINSADDNEVDGSIYNKRIQLPETPGRFDFDIRILRELVATGIVVTPDDHPAGGALVFGGAFEDATVAVDKGVFVAEAAASVAASARTGPTGEFELKLREADSFVFVVQSGVAGFGGFDLVRKSRQEVAEERLVLRLKPDSVVFGRVLDPAGAPLAGVRVALRDDDGLALPSSTGAQGVTTSEGTFRLQRGYISLGEVPLSLGDHVLRSRSATLTARLDGFMGVEVEVPLDSPEPQEIHLSRPLAIRGRVEFDGLPVPQFRWQLVRASPGGVRTEETIGVALDPDGRFEAHPETTGHFRLSVSAPGTGLAGQEEFDLVDRDVDLVLRLADSPD